MARKANAQSARALTPGDDTQERLRRFRESFGGLPVTLGAFEAEQRLEAERAAERQGRHRKSGRDGDPADRKHEGGRLRHR